MKNYSTEFTLTIALLLFFAFTVLFGLNVLNKKAETINETQKIPQSTKVQIDPVQTIQDWPCEEPNCKG